MLVLKHQISLRIDRVENIVSTASAGQKFSELRDAINNLQSASAKLDIEKEMAKKAFENLLHGKYASSRRYLFRQVIDRIDKFFGVYPRHGCGHGHYHLTDGYWLDIAFGMADDNVAKEHDGHGGTRFHHHEAVRSSSRKFINAAKRVRRANQKLVAFERGFISDEGIRNREWYKHLGVAPGLWLGQSPLPIRGPLCTHGFLCIGYGATTFPGLTEALTFDKNATLVQNEASRLTDLLQKLSVELSP
jgi:N-acetylated-alpha-linked acidic dipeptidase